jgi:hypothetical protein
MHLHHVLWASSRDILSIPNLKITSEDTTEFSNGLVEKTYRCLFPYIFIPLSFGFQSSRSKAGLVLTMSIPNKPSNRATNAVTGSGKELETKGIMVLDYIKNKIQSELSPANNRYMVFGKDKKPEGFRMEFAFEVNLRKYLGLWGQVLGEKRRLSNMITFTSAASDIDALAVPASMYVRDTWGRDGIKILQMVENAVGGSEIREVSTSKLICKSLSP